ncbi:YbdK family carboxylate-amine ligase [Candidatus Neomarinimicrobiota bacterium]
MTQYANVFSHRHPFTLGVEEEYMLCHPDTGNLIPRADRILAIIPEEEKERFTYELILSEIEINTPVSQSVADVMDQVRHYRRKVRDLGRDLDFRMGISGTHPTALGDEQEFVDSPGYQWVAQQLHYYAQRNITFAVHVHVALPDADAAIAVTNAARRWLAPMLAVSANSPFFQAHDTGMLSARTFQFGAFPRTNIPETFRDFEHFQQVLESYIAMESIHLPRQIWWKIRPHATYGTVEFRVADMQRSLKRTEMLIALSQAISHRIVMDLKAGTLQQQFELELLNDALWKATRFGFDAKVMDASDFTLMSMSEMVERMVEYASPSLLEFGTEHVVKTVEEVLENGSEAQEQLSIYQSGGFKELQQMLMKNVEFESHA